MSFSLVPFQASDQAPGIIDSSLAGKRKRGSGGTDLDEGLQVVLRDSKENRISNIVKQRVRDFSNFFGFSRENESTPFHLTTIEGCPNEIIIGKIFNYLPPKDRVNVSEVCRRFRDLAKDDVSCKKAYNGFSFDDLRSIREFGRIENRGMRLDLIYKDYKILKKLNINSEIDEAITNESIKKLKNHIDIIRKKDIDSFYSALKELLFWSVKHSLTDSEAVHEMEKPKRTYLNISNYQMQSLPKMIFKFNQLEVLDLDSNNLIYLPESIGNLNRLMVLSISGNRKLKRLPESIGNLKRLRNLDADSTGLIALPESMSKLKKLRYLNINRTYVKSLPKIQSSWIYITCNYSHWGNDNFFESFAKDNIIFQSAWDGKMTILIDATLTGFFYRTLYLNWT